VITTDIFRTSTFRLTASFAIIFTLSTLLLFSFIYWQTAVAETRRVESELERDARAIAEDTHGNVLDAVRIEMATRSHRITYVSLFAPDGQLQAGNLERVPQELRADGHAHRRTIDTGADGLHKSVDILIVRRGLADGRSLVIGRSLDSVDNLRGVVLRALRLGTLATIAVALAAGTILSRRAQEQIKAVRLTAERIVAGHLSERLPRRGSNDDFDRLADIVNHMLDDIERLLAEAQTTGENIAHDLRTPLTRVRSRLERARHTSHTVEELREMIDSAIISLDQTLRIITALLRIGQIEGGRRRASFSSIDLKALVGEMGDLFDPFAEAKGIQFRTLVDNTVVEVSGDRDLLSEAIANLLDNAIKFTPAGGAVQLHLTQQSGSPVVTITDNGPGIAPAEREAVIRRFYRSDKSRHVEGCGLGLSLVDAIVRLHGFRIEILDANPGCAVKLICPNDNIPTAE
jgi:hypothetical protein